MPVSGPPGADADADVVGPATDGGEPAVSEADRTICTAPTPTTSTSAPAITPDQFGPVRSRLVPAPASIPLRERSGRPGAGSGASATASTCGDSCATVGASRRASSGAASSPSTPQIARMWPRAYAVPPAGARSPCSMASMMVRLTRVASLTWLVVIPAASRARASSAPTEICWSDTLRIPSSSNDGGGHHPGRRGRVRRSCGPRASLSNHAVLPSLGRTQRKSQPHLINHGQRTRRTEIPWGPNVTHRHPTPARRGGSLVSYPAWPGCRAAPRT